MAKVDGGPVVAHAQAFADEINRRFGFTHIMTYPGHEPDQQHALDNFSSRSVMLQLAEWCTHDDVIDRYGIDYVIFNVDESTIGGEIYNREISRSWRHMPDRGGVTQNHHDHVHVSFNKTAQGPFTPTPAPKPVPQEDDMPAQRLCQPAGEGVWIVGEFKRWIKNPADLDHEANLGFVDRDGNGKPVIHPCPEDWLRRIPNAAGSEIPKGWEQVG